MNLSKIIILSILIVIVSGCASQNSRILAGENQVQLRSMQTRSFDTEDKNTVVRNIISTLQDLSFVIDKADADLGTVSATKLSGYQIRMTVTARAKSSNSVVVRASAQYNLKPIEDAVMYQDFFVALSKSLFLSANSVE
ncbi:MAG: hypothetical protein QMC38_11695 [Sinobacterium sp.]|jgi:uncharacterized protein YceK